MTSSLTKMRFSVGLVLLKSLRPPLARYTVSTTLAVEANNGGSRLYLAVDWASESVASFQVIRHHRPYHTAATIAWLRIMCRRPCLVGIEFA